MTNKNFALAGAGLLTVGLFLPIVTLPFLGTINLFNGGTNWVALGLLALAVVSAALALKDRTGDVILTGIAATGALAYKFIMLQISISEMRSNLADDLKDNPFAGIAHTALSSVQLQWGWLVLALGAGFLVYAGLKERKEIEAPLLQLPDGVARGVAAVSVAALLIGPALDAYATARRDRTTADTVNGANTAISPPGASPVPTSDSGKLDREKADYIAQNVVLYDLESKYYDSMLEGRIPGVDFKIKNKGNRTLNRVKVRVVFQDEQGNPIAEEEYNPVLVSEMSFGSDNKPLRPNYIWQQEADKFLTAKSVPSEWKAGKATASIIDIEFGPSE